MNKNIIVLLLQKDIKELSQLTDGFDELDEFPEPLLRLAKDKAENITQALKKLGNLSSAQLGTIHSSSLDENKADEDVKNELYFGGKNNFDIPLDSSLMEQDEPCETEIQNADAFLGTTDLDDTKSDEVKERVIDTNLTESNGVAEDSTAEMEGVEQEDTDKTSHKVDTYDNDNHERNDVLGIEISDVNTENERIGISEITVNTILYDTLVDEDNSISSNLANKKIGDIRQAINVGDRFRFQRELFGGNGEVLNKTIAYLNQLAHFSEAEKFLNTKFNWTKDNVHAQEFLQIVKRRYL
ncbi:MAG: hypothetical protein ACK5KP_09920 [Paludibacteraceae bacterium]